MCPHFDTTAAIAVETETARVTSQPIATASFPRRVISDAIRAQDASLRAASATRAPSAANRREIASPIPRDAPVTKATLPDSRRESVRGGGCSARRRREPVSSRSSLS